MKLYQINEPEEIIESDSAVVGIDLGTTNSLIAYSVDGKAEVLAHAQSIVEYVGKKFVVGAEGVHSIKRQMGKGNQGVKCGEGSFTAVEISAQILLHLKKQAETKLKKKIHKAIITVPAYFDEGARQATKDAAMLAGIEVLRLINEPTAAAVAYGLDNKVEGTYLIYDLGGGTFDVSILKMQRGVLQVLATNGDSNLGGDDFDSILVELIFNKYPPHKLQSDNACLLAARKIKESFGQVYKGAFPHINGDIEISCEEFEQAIEPLVARTKNLVQNCLKDAGVEFANIKDIILVGGSTRLALIKRMLSQNFKKPIDNVDPEKIVAIGAAIQAEGLSRGSSNLLIDVTPLSLGIEVAAGLVDVIIPRNTPLPFAQKQMFTTQADGQTAFKIHVLQGESQLVKNCRSISRFELKGIPPMHAKEARLEINFQIDADGLLTVSAQEKISGVAQTIEVKPSYGLSEEQMLELLKGE